MGEEEEEEEQPFFPPSLLRFPRLLYPLSETEVEELITDRKRKKKKKRKGAKREEDAYTKKEEDFCSCAFRCRGEEGREREG